MNRSRRALILLVVLVLLGPCEIFGVSLFHSALGWTQPGGSVVPTLQRIEAARTQVQTLEAEFDQERTMSLFAQTLRAHGRVIVARPDRIRWEILTPSPGTFIVAGGRVSYRAGGSSASATQSQVGTLGSVLGDLAAFLGGPMLPLLRRYRMNFEQRADRSQVLTAVPMDPAIARTISSVRLEFQPDLRTITAVEIQEPNGDRAHIRLQNVRINATRIDQRTFAP